MIAASGDGVADRVALGFTLLDRHIGPRDIQTSLRLPVPTGAGSHRPRIAVILYAATPGAFATWPPTFLL